MQEAIDQQDLLLFPIHDNGNHWNIYIKTNLVK